MPGAVAPGAALPASADAGALASCLPQAAKSTRPASKRVARLKLFVISES
jgi:hypothetical protein